MNGKELIFVGLMIMVAMPVLTGMVVLGNAIEAYLCLHYDANSADWLTAAVMTTLIGAIAVVIGAIMTLRERRNDR